MKEIADYTDLKVEYTLKKNGKQFTRIVFQIGTKRDLDERWTTWQKINQQIASKDEKRPITVTTVSKSDENAENAAEFVSAETE